ncbi:uncharacterized protein DUF4249 [Chitinophaga skermanii]|uniref:Uncharacterized protein DUF4249 n=1 Tax=Chitinophaga skermanii TaxID=331697 RepID=A0A327R1R1_9BACT|nr:DUF4249 domain-containing protein [Chitinophaga skermanii]RAJ10789.1 uncharacterized protein DUF4249 [Chitinophaga skermanii]
MQKLIQHIALFLLLVASFTTQSCEKTVNLDVPYEGDKLVLNSFIQPDSVIYLRVTVSGKPSNTSFAEVTNAKVQLMENDVEIPVTFQRIKGFGYYVSTEKAKLGKQYKYVVGASGLDEVSGRDTLPHAPFINLLRARKGGIRARFYLHDRPRVKEYYRVRMYAGDSSAVTHKIEPKVVKKFRFDPSYSNAFTDIATENYYDYALITDERFDGKDTPVVLQLQEAHKAKDFIVVEVTSLTETAYQYLKSLDQQRMDEGNVLVEPTRVYSNVLNGYGIVAGVNVRRIYFKIPD